MNEQHHIIIIPGLGDSEKKIHTLQRYLNWERHGIQIHFFQMDWQNRQNQNVQAKFEKLTETIAVIKKQPVTLSLIGLSAGGSAVVNTFTNNKKDIHRVINVCGRLRTGPLTGYRSFSAKTKSSPMFAESILLWEKNEAFLPKSDRKKIMTMRSLIWDELVPPETVTIQGSKNIQIPMVEHGLSILSAMTWYSKPIIQFITEM